MADLAQELIKARAQARSWTLQSYPGKIKLPSDILRSLPSPDAVAKVIDLHGSHERFMLRNAPGGQNTVSVRGNHFLAEGD